MFHFWSVGASTSWPLNPFDRTLLVFESSLLSSVTKCSSLILYISYPNLELPFSSRSPGSFSGKLYLETTYWVLEVLIATGLVIFSRPFHWTVIGIFKISCTIFKGYTSFTVITKYWLCFLCCTVHPCSLSYTQ